MLKTFKKNISSLFLVVILAIFVLFLVNNSRHGDGNFVNVEIGKTNLRMELADNQLSRVTGLSYRDSIGSDGMLFVFTESSAENCFWMKDMKFSIDMVWLSSDKTVLSIDREVSPETFPNTFCPVSPAKYGIEINAGTAQNYGFEIGKQVKF